MSAPAESKDDTLLPITAFSKEGSDYVQTTTLPSSGQKTEVKFRLDQKMDSKNKAGATISVSTNFSGFSRFTTNYGLENYRVISDLYMRQTVLMFTDDLQMERGNTNLIDGI